MPSHRFIMISITLLLVVHCLASGPLRLVTKPFGKRHDHVNVHLETPDDSLSPRRLQRRTIEGMEKMQDSTPSSPAFLHTRTNQKHKAHHSSRESHYKGQATYVSRAVLRGATRADYLRLFPCFSTSQTRELVVLQIRRATTLEP